MSGRWARGPWGRSSTAVFQRVFAAAKEVRNSTEIGRHPASVRAWRPRWLNASSGTSKGGAVLVLAAAGWRS